MLRWKTTKVTKFAMAGFLVVLFSMAFSRAYVRTESTLLGYKLGAMKSYENKLLENRSYLRSELAKLTRKNKLMKLAKIKPNHPHLANTPKAKL